MGEEATGRREAGGEGGSAAMKIEILTIGGEILSGRTADTNFLYLARALNRLGAPPTWHTTVPDHRDLLANALRAALGRAQGILMTGGLGATPDDITRRVLAQVLRRRLVLREEVRAELERVYRLRGHTPPPMAEGMALIPQGAEIIPNPVGLAPGLLVPTAGEGWIVALPGVPEEMRGMVERFVLPFLERRLGGGRTWEVVLRTAGVPETILAERLGAEHPPGTEIAYLPYAGGVDLRLVRRFDAALNSEDFEAWVKEIRDLLGPAVYAVGETTLEQRVGDLAKAAGMRLAAAESITGGAVGAAITRVPGASAYYLGSVCAYDNEAKIRILGVLRPLLAEHGAVSGPVAEAMASGARRLFGADVAVATTGVAGPSGGTEEKPVGLVYFGVSTPEGETSLRRAFPGRSRELITARATATAVHLFYRKLAGLPLED